MIPIKNPLNELYKHKEEIGADKIFIIVNNKTKEELEKFNIFEVPTLSDELLEKSFKKSITTSDRKQTTFYVE